MRTAQVLALAVLASAALTTGTAHAGRTEIIAGGGLVFPRTSKYREAAEALGYDRRSLRHTYNAELGVVFGATSWLRVGPLARLYAGRLGAPYDGVRPIDTYAGSIAARVEVELYSFPHLFAWLDPEIGLGSIGVPDARKSIGFWGLRAGFGVATVESQRIPFAFRFRVGYAVAPTFGDMYQANGPFDFGGILVQFDGVFRASP